LQETATTAVAAATDRLPHLLQWECQSSWMQLHAAVAVQQLQDGQKQLTL
jgi:hypothetical protein